MQISPRHRKQSHTGTFAAVIAVLVIAGMVVLLRAPLAGVLWQGMRPALSMRAAAGEAAGTVDAQFMSKGALYAENQELRAELASTSAALADRNALFSENQDLKRRFSGDTHAILAGIIARPPFTPYDEMVIDAGSRDGVTQGDFVSAGGTLVIGVVSQTYTTTSRVTLFSSPTATYDALLQTQDGKSVPVAIEGQGMGSMRGTVPAGTSVSLGDSVSFAGTAGKFVGSVASVVAPDDQSVKTIYLHEPVDVFSLRYVHVLHVIQ